MEKSDRPLRSHPGAATSPASLGPVFTAWGPGSQGGSLGLSEHRALHLPLPRPRPHSRRCSWLVTKAGPGTSSSHWVWWFLSGSLVIVIVCSTLGLIICVKRRKPRGEHMAAPSGLMSPAVASWSSVTPSLGGGPRAFPGSAAPHRAATAGWGRWAFCCGQSPGVSWPPWGKGRWDP